MSMPAPKFERGTAARPQRHYVATPEDLVCINGSQWDIFGHLICARCAQWAGVQSELHASYDLRSTSQFLTSLVGVAYNGHSTQNWVILIVALTACVAALQAEVVKGALNSFDTGQADAAYSLVYKKSQFFRRIMLPQIIVAAILDRQLVHGDTRSW